MLVLSRKVGETIVLDKNIKVYFLQHLTMGKIRIGIEAPKNVSVDRGEKIKPETMKYDEEQ